LRSLKKSQIFSPDWPELDLIRAESSQKGRKHGAQGPRLVLHSFYEQFLQINLVSSLNWKVLPKVKRSFPDWPELGHIRDK